MEQLKEVKNTLNFYVLANKLKTTIIDEEHNYSVADNLFGSMILALAMDSEFSETENLGKLLRMMLLDNFTRLNPNYDIQNSLKKGSEYKEEINRACSLQSKDSKLIFKYRMLDFMLTKLIKEKESKLEYSELVRESLKIFNPKNPLEYSKYEEIFRFYYLNFKLKNKIRSGWDNKHWNINSNRIERISEHIIGTMALAIVIDSEFNYNEELDFIRNVDINRVLRVLAMHEIGETLIGDITPFDGITPEEKEEMEHKAMIDALGNLSKKDELLDMLLEFDKHSSNESVFEYFCDKIEADLQSKFYQDSGLHNSLDNQENNCVFKSKKVQEMLNNGAKTAFDIWYWYDAHIYEDSICFPEFSSILKVARDNDILTLDKGITNQLINISEDEYSFIIKKLYDVIKQLLSEYNVEGIYLTNYQNCYDNNGTINLTIIFNNAYDVFECESIINRVNLYLRENNNTKVELESKYNFLCDYVVRQECISNIKNREELLLSSIIFDKNGFLNNIKSSIVSDSYTGLHNLVKYIPPIDEPLARILKK